MSPRRETVTIHDVDPTSVPRHRHPPARRIRDMFAAIVPRYDIINTLMTLGLDRHWRAQTVVLAEPAGKIALDIATGTGELAFAMARNGAQKVIGADFCPEMLRVATQKMERAELLAAVGFVAADAVSLPFAEATFDCIVNGFMLRNVVDLPATFAELCRVLKPGGRLVCLDLTAPSGPLRRFFSWYIAALVPMLGLLVGRNYRAYRYLYESLSIHPDADQIVAILHDAGFITADYILAGFGTVAIHRADKAAGVKLNSRLAR